jgi:lysozyme
MNYGPAGLALTKSFEGCRLTAYQDSAGVPTIGWGHTPTTLGTVWTQEQADAQLVIDTQWANSVVNKSVTSEINQNQHDAMVDFTYNVGSGNFTGSTLLRLVNQGNFQLASEQFGEWVHAGGQVIPGLVRRRQAEANLFLEAV